MALSIQLPSDMENRLARLVQAAGHDPAFYVIEALREHLDDIEDAYLAASLAEKVEKFESIKMRNFVNSSKLEGIEIPESDLSLDDAIKKHIAAG